MLTPTITPLHALATSHPERHIMPAVIAPVSLTDLASLTTFNFCDVSVHDNRVFVSSRSTARLTATHKKLAHAPDIKIHDSAFSFALPA